MWLLYELLNIGMPDMQDSSSPLRVRILDGLFQATGLRNSGAYVVTIASLAPARPARRLPRDHLHLLLPPIVMALRQTNTYEERSVGLSSSSSSPSPSSLGTHFRRQLAYDLWFQLLAWFLIHQHHRAAQATPRGTPSPLFSLLFEVTSALRHPSALSTTGSVPDGLVITA